MFAIQLMKMAEIVILKTRWKILNLLWLDPPEKSLGRIKIKIRFMLWKYNLDKYKYYDLIAYLVRFLYLEKI